MSFFSNLFGGANNGLVNGAQAREAVSHGAILLDVRTPMEHEAGTIPGSKNIAVQELAQRRRAKVTQSCKAAESSAQMRRPRRRRPFAGERDA